MNACGFMSIRGDVHGDVVNTLRLDGMSLEGLVYCAFIINAINIYFASVSPQLTSFGILSGCGPPLRCLAGPLNKTPKERAVNTTGAVT